MRTPSLLKMKIEAAWSYVYKGNAASVTQGMESHGNEATHCCEAHLSHNLCFHTIPSHLNKTLSPTDKTDSSTLVSECFFCIGQRKFPLPRWRVCTRNQYVSDVSGRSWFSAVSRSLRVSDQFIDARRLADDDDGETFSRTDYNLYCHVALYYKHEPFRVHTFSGLISVHRSEYRACLTASNFFQEK